MNAAYILVVDDEPDIRELISEILSDEGYQVATAADGASADKAVQQRRPDLILLDIWMPDIDGISLMKRWLHESRNPGARPGAIVMMSGHGTVETAVEATRLGACDFIEKPISLAKLLQTVEEALKNSQKNSSPAQTPPSATIEPIGNSPAMRALRDALKKLAKTHNHVLFQGEPGTGKLTLAQWLHSQRHGHRQPAIVVDGLSLDDNHFETMLFAPGGLLEQADGGSLILTNIDCLTEKQQSAWLSLLKHKQYPLAGQQFKNIRFDLLATSQRDLQELAAAGEFFRDLYDVLGEVRLQVPPLRERAEDVPDLISHFINHLPDLEKTPYRKMSIAAQNRLRNYHWPGNVRELKNVVRQLQLEADSGEITLEQVDNYLRGAQNRQQPSIQCRFDLPLREAREAFERDYLLYQLQACDGSVGELAKVAGMERTHLYRKLRALKINPKSVQARKDSNGADKRTGDS